MTRRTTTIARSTLVAAAVLAALAVLWLNARKPNSAVVAPAGPGTPPDPATYYESLSAKDRETLKTALQNLVGALDLQPPTSVEIVLASAVASGDDGEIRRRFQRAIYDRFANLEESVPAFRKHLRSEKPYVRLLAAESLLITGDRSGVDALIELLGSPDPILRELELGKFDVRDSAANLLGRFRIAEAVAPLQEYHQRTGSPDAAGALTALGRRPLVPEKRYRGSSAAGWYGKVLASEYVPDLTTTFATAPMTEYRISAAWSLARITGDEKFVDYLIEASESAIASPPTMGASRTPGAVAVRYLGAIQSPNAVATLERALGSGNPRASNDALVNLLFNQKVPSQLARQRLLEQLTGADDYRIPGDLAMRIVAALDDPELRQAAEQAGRRSSGYRWHYWGVQRRNWPVENWIYDHVELLNPR